MKSAWRATALRESGDEEVGPLLDYENNPELWDRCKAIADEAGAYGFVALDLAVALHNPRRSPGICTTGSNQQGGGLGV